MDAGADVITTNSFVLTPFALAQGRAPWDPPATSDAPRPDELATLLHAAARCASEAAASAGGQRSVLVAGCLPPLATSYKPEEVRPEAEMLTTYRALVAELAALQQELFATRFRRWQRLSCIAAAPALRRGPRSST